MVPNPLSISKFSMIARQKSISVTPLGSSVTTSSMLNFACRHNIEQITETYSFDGVNEAMEKLP
ncbi:MAG: hypothetical protein AAFV71_00825 [Cyanobacteria bacterium J06633_8]